MEPVSTNAQQIAVTAVPPPTPPPAAGAITPAVGASGPPAVAAPVVTPAVTQPAAPVESPELAAIRAERTRLEGEIARLTPWAQRGFQASQVQSTPAPATPAPAPKTNVFGVPDLDPQVEAWITTDASGNTVERPGAPPGALGQYLAHQRAMGNALKKLAQDPEGSLAPFLAKLEAAATEKAQKAVSAEQQRVQNEQIAAQIVERNADWMFAKDAQGNRVIVTDSLTGQRQYQRTEGGEVWAQEASRLMQAGMTDPVMVDRYARAAAWQWAWERTEAAKSAVSQTTQPGVQPIPVVHPIVPVIPPPSVRDAFLNRIPGANPGSINPPAGANPPDTRRLPLGQAMLQNLIAAGYNPGSRIPIASNAA